MRSVGRPRGSRDLLGAAHRVRRPRAEMEALFGRTLRRARESVDVSASELAAALGVHPSSVHAWESGLHGPMAWRLFAIADALGLPVSHLLEGR